MRKTVSPVKTQGGGSPSRFAALLGLVMIVGPAAAQEKINYTDHILPLVEANCSKCHNPDRHKADLDLTTYPAALKGSGSGAIVVSGNPDSSKLWKALMHTEEPFMPPNRPKLPDKDLDVFKKWILDGLLETAGGKAIAIAKPEFDLALKPEELGKPEGPPPMPKDWPLEPVIHTARMRAITGLAASPWAPLVAVAGQQQVLVFNTDSLELLGILPFGEGEPVNVKFSRNGKLLLAGGGRGAKSGRVVLWDTVTGEHLMTLGKEYDTVLAADIRPDQSQVALGGPGRLVKILSTGTGELLHKMKKHTDWVTALAYSPNGQILASADRNGGISLWDPDSGQELFTLAGHKAAVTALSWRADSKLLASASEDGTVKLWETQEGKQVKSWTAHGAGVLCVNYASDGRLVTCGRDNTVALWNGNGSKLRQFPFDNLPVQAVLSDDGQRVIACNFGGRVTVWSAKDGKLSGELNSNPPPLAEQLAFACKRLKQLQEQANMDATQAKAAIPADRFAEARTQVSRLQAAQILTSIYQARERAATARRQKELAAAALTKHREEAQAAQKTLAAAQAAAAKTQAALQTAQAEIAREGPLAERAAAAQKNAEAELQRLLAQYRDATAPPEKLAAQTRK